MNVNVNEYFADEKRIFLNIRCRYDWVSWLKMSIVVIKTEIGRVNRKRLESISTGKN